MKLKNNYNLLWDAQKEFLVELARANDIAFDPDRFENRTRRSGFLSKRFYQSDAALYIGAEIDKIRQSGGTIFYPWRTNALYIGFNGKKYSETPWLYIPTCALQRKVGDKQVIKAVGFNISGGPEDFLQDNGSKRSPVLICKSCLHEWKHYCGRNVNGQPIQNPDDVITCGNDDSKHPLAFKCPVCGSLEVYKVGEFYWD